MMPLQSRSLRLHRAPRPRRWPLVALLVAGCAQTPLPARVEPKTAAGCPTVALPWTPPPLPEETVRQCAKNELSFNAARVHYGHDIERTVCYVAERYVGPDGLPINAMLEGALKELVRVFPDIELSGGVGGDGYTLSSLRRSTSVGPIKDDAIALGAALVHAAEYTHVVLKPEAFQLRGSAEHILLQGALGALQRKGWILGAPGETLIPPRTADDGAAAPPSSLAVVGGQTAVLKIGAYEKGMVANIRGQLAQTPGLRGVILDLRGSPGGPLEVGLELIDLFAQEGCMIVTRPAAQASRQTAAAQPGDLLGPVVVLVDHRTAAGAELVAATLRARGRAIVVGEKTAGKALMQTPIELDSGAIIALSVGEMLAGDGTIFDGAGVTPDLAVPKSFPRTESADRAGDFAGLLLQRAKGNGRSDLLQAAATFDAAAATP